MRSFLSLPVLALAPLAAAAQEPSVALPEVARLEVQGGRALVRTSAGASTTLRRDEVRSVAGPAHVEIGAGAQVRLTWVGRASLEVHGPAALQWDLLPEPVVAAPSMDTFSARGLELNLFDVAWADFEVRRGEHVLRLPGDWRVDCGAGAWHVRGLPSGPLELHHHAGRAARLTWLGDENAARPPLSLYPGSSVRLDRLQADGRDSVAEPRQPAWEEGEWPWRETNDGPADRAERDQLSAETDRMPGFPTRDPAAQGPRASVKGVVDPGELRVVVDPVGASPNGPAAGRRGGASPAPQLPRGETEPRREGTPVPVAPVPRAPSTRPQETRERTLPRPTPESAPAPVTVTVTDERGVYRADDWRGVPFGRLELVGTVLVEEAAGTEVRVFPSGRFKVLVDPSAERGSWVFSPTRDYRLSAGAVLMFDVDGGVALRFGPIEEFAPQAGRAGDPRR